MPIYLILALICVACSQQSSLYHRRDLSMERGASCLDGTNPVIYVHEGTDDRKFLIFFDRGGLCQGSTLEQTIRQCYQRSLTDLGSTTHAPSTKSFHGKGILSPIKSENPTFYNWTKVFLTYCDGSAFLGNRDESYHYTDHRLYFRGQKNVMQVFRHLELEYDFLSKKQIVIAGVQVGGIAALVYSNYLSDSTQSSRVLILADSSISVLDFPSLISNISIFESITSELAALVLDVQSVPKQVRSCIYSNHGHAGRCFSAISYIKSVITPRMFIQSTYDSESITNIIQAQCLSSEKPHSLADCNQTQIQAIERYRLEMIQLFRDFSYYGANLWSPSCVQHGFLDGPLFSDASYTVRGVSLSEAVYRLIQSPLRIQELIDPEGWSTKEGCNTLPVPQIQRQLISRNYSAQPHCFAGKRFQFDFKQNRLLVIEGSNGMYQGCVGFLHKFTLTIDSASQENRIQFTETASGGCRDMIVSAYKGALERSVNYSVVSASSGQQLHLLNQNGRLELILMFNRQRRKQEINQQTLEGFYSMRLPPIYLDFTNDHFRMNLCGAINKDYIFSDDMLHFGLPQSQNWQCTDPYMMYIYMAMSSSWFSLDNCDCRLKKIASQREQSYTLIAKLAQEKFIYSPIGFTNSPLDFMTPTDPPSPPADAPIPLIDPVSIVGEYILSLYSTVLVSVSQTMIEFKGCSNVKSKYTTSKGNKISFAAFYTSNLQSCDHNRDNEYAYRFHSTRKYKVNPRGLTFLDAKGSQTLELQTRT